MSARACVIQSIVQGSPQRSILAAAIGLAAVVAAPGPSARALAPPIAPPAPAAPAPVLKPPVAEAPVHFAYPPALLQRRSPPTGAVVIQYVVGVDGVPRELEVLDSADPGFDATALEAVAALRFEAARYEGQAVEVLLSIELTFVPPTPPDLDPDLDPGSAISDGSDTPEAADPGPSPAAAPLRISGALLGAGSGVPVGGAAVLAVPAGEYPDGRVKRRLVPEHGGELEPEWVYRTTTTDTGGFELRGVPDGRVRLVFLAANFERLEWVVTLAPDAQLETKYFLTRSSGAPFRTEVEVDRDLMPEAVVRTIKLEEINEIPGTYGDALKAVQNFPGVARAAFGAGQLSIRGAAPGDSGVYLGYHEIPTLFHFGGLSSVFNSDILAQIDFIPGNFDSRYGDALGGIVNVVPRKGRRDGYHGYVDADLFDAGALVEGRVGEGSFIVSARRSYVDAILPLVIPEEAGLGLTLAPRYWDYQGLFDYPLPAPVGGELSVRVFGSDDRAKLLFVDANEIEPDARDSLETVQWFHRADLVYRRRDGPWEVLLTPSYKREFLSSSIFGGTRFDLESDTFSARAELSRQLSARLRIRVGAEFVGSWYEGRAELPGSGAGSPSPALAQAQTRETTYRRMLPGLYSTLTWRVAQRLVLSPGVRLNHYNDGAQLARTTVDPRLRFIAQLTPDTALKGGVGLYSQGPGLIEADLVFGNPLALPQRALHTSFGVAQTLPWDISVELTGFYKRLESLLSQSTDLRRRPGADPAPQNFANVGTGNIFGAELLIKKPLGDNFYGWLSYTLMRSTRTPAPGRSTQLFDFDQTHILTLIASYDFPFNWRIGARFRLVSGNPYTATVNGVVAADDGGATYIPIRGPANGARLPAFHQLDLRVDKTWVYRRIKITAYLDVQNVYNAENTEFLNYSYDFQSTLPILSLPTAPSIGTKIEW